MTHAHPIPDVHASGRFAVENMTGCTIALLGAGKRDNQIQLRAGIDYPANAAKNPIYFAESAKAIDINWRQARGLHEQFFVCHENPPERVRGHQNTIVSGARQKCEAQLLESFVAPRGINLLGTDRTHQAAVRLTCC